MLQMHVPRVVGCSGQKFVGDASWIMSQLQEHEVVACRNRRTKSGLVFAEGNGDIRSKDATYMNALEVVETGAVVSSVCLAAASVACRNDKVARLLSRKKADPEKHKTVAVKKGSTAVGGDSVTVADQLAIWTIVPLSIVALCGAVIKGLEQRRQNSVGYSMSEIEREAIAGRKEVEMLERRVSRLRLRLKIVHASLRETVEGLVDEGAQNREGLLGLAGQLEKFQDRLRDYDEVLLKMQDSSFRQFNALVKAIQQMETKCSDAEQEAGVQVEETSHDEEDPMKESQSQ